MSRTGPFLVRRALASAVLGGALVVSLAATALPVAAEDLGDIMHAITREKFTPMDPSLGEGVVFGAVGTRSVPNPICTTSTSGAANRNTDCDAAAPHNETSLAVNPTNANNIIGGANDYQLGLSNGGTIYETTYSRAHVSVDGGNTWTEYPLTNQNAYTSTGDPAVAFDATGRAYYATLGFGWSQNNPCCKNPDVFVETSTNGGVTWSKGVRVAAGSGYFTSPGVFNDKEYVAAWGDGNAIVTWTHFNDGIKGSYLSSPIYASVTHDGGNSWTPGVEISGSAAFCLGADGTGNQCNAGTFSTPAVAADGSIYVSWVDYTGDANGRDDYLVVKVDPTTGQRVAGPYLVGLVYDGFSDYPFSIDARQTLQDSQFRTNPAGNLSADPTNANHLAVVWSDMRNGGAGTAFADPYTVTTNSDVIVSQSWDGGQTWSAPSALTRRRDQFQPWSGYRSDGKLVLGFFDRYYDSANHQYGYTKAVETSAGSLNFSLTQWTTALSDPTKNTRWFSGRTPNTDFPHPTTFIGDYSGIAVNGTTAYGYWADLRNLVDFAGRTDHGSDAFFGR